ncbi:uncharacterized protein LOC110465264 [Mizuhopecten yessoensis]|uniref:uncharacterized protein LOC110465264 n=1 Tax=Mizuhopecten yessoensis TaxID=6573 RepID=UPI000B45E5F4|nr:uncharacterized protein LOC110465264 [Mizuhopecten yessoensis]
MNYIIDNYISTIIDALATSTSDGLWIGYNDCAEEGVFRTFDGQLATWFTWLDKQPNDAVQLNDQDCVVLSAKKFEGWEDKACEEPRIALCYRTFTNENGTTTTGEDTCSTAISTEIPVTIPIETETTSKKTPTVTTLTGNTSDSKCPVCKFEHAPNLLTPKELLEYLARLRLDTCIYYKNTSAYRRRHVSVYEPRIMAKCMGVTAGAVLVAVVLCLVILDLKSCRAKQRPPLNRLVRRI